MWEWAARPRRAGSARLDQPGQRAVAGAHPRAGFVEVGSQIDEIDGLELIFEKPAG